MKRLDVNGVADAFSELLLELERKQEAQTKAIVRRLDALEGQLAALEGRASPKQPAAALSVVTRRS